MYIAIVHAYNYGCTCCAHVQCVACQQKAAVYGHVLVPKVVHWLLIAFHKALSFRCCAILLDSVHNGIMVAYSSSIWPYLLYSLVAF